MQTQKKSTAKQPSSKLFVIVGVLAALIIIAVWAFYAFNKPNSTDNAAKNQSTQSSDILSVNESLQQNGATQICSAGNTGSGSLTKSSTNIVYEISKNRSDTVDVITKVANDSGYGNLSRTTNGSADFYEGKSKDASSTISFVVYSDRKYASCDPTPSNDPSQTGFILSITHDK